MVTIRLRRQGKTKQPTYRIVIADKRSPRDGKFIEIIGHYNPVRQPKELVVKQDRARYWLGVGAQATDRVARFLDAAGIKERAARNNPKKAEPGEKAKERAEERAAKAAEAEEAAKAAAEAPAAEEPAVEETVAEEVTSVSSEEPVEGGEAVVDEAIEEQAAEAPAEEAPAAEASEEKAEG